MKKKKKDECKPATTDHVADGSELGSNDDGGGSTGGGPNEPPPSGS